MLLSNIKALIQWCHEKVSKVFNLKYELYENYKFQFKSIRFWKTFFKNLLSGENKKNEIPRKCLFRGKILFLNGKRTKTTLERYICRKIKIVRCKCDDQTSKAKF